MGLVKLVATLFCLILFSISSSLAAREFNPHGFVLPVAKDASTGQHITRLHQRTPSVPVNLTVDLGGESLWVNCINKNFSSSSYVFIRCNRSSENCACSTCDGPTRVGCHSNSCRMVAQNPMLDDWHTSDIEIYRDLLGVQSVTDDGRNPGRLVQVKRFLFGCEDEEFMFGRLPKGVQGIAGLGKGYRGIPSQLAKSYNLPLKFSICLSSSTKSNGVIFVGDGPYVFLPGIDVSKSLMYTPLLQTEWVLTRDSKGTPKSEYYIGVTGIKINDKTLPINTTVLNIQDRGVGGTLISTLQNFTLLETSTFDVVTKAFEKELQHIPKAEASPPFKLCYNAKSLGSTRVGPAVPTIDFVLHNDKVLWRIFGSNSMVSVGKDKLCLAFVDGGPLADTETYGTRKLMDHGIVIGGHQLEDNLVQFDVENSRIGFSNSLLLKQTTCGNFNFTSLG